MGPVLDGVVADKLELRRIAELEGMAQLPAEEAGGGFQPLENLFFLVLVQHADIDPGIAQIVGGVHPGDGHHAGAGDPGVLQIAELGRQLPLDFVVDAVDSVGCHRRSPFLIKAAVTPPPLSCPY